MRQGAKMQNLKSFFLLILLIFFAYAPVLAFDAPTIFKNSKDSVVLLMSFDKNGQPLSIGSGFFIHNGKKLVSNFHVLNGASSVKAKTASGKVIEIKEIIGINLKYDLIILSSPFKGEPLLLSDRKPEIGENIIAIGNPKGLEGTLSMGIISGIRIDKGNTYYQITAPISPGSSGGPIIDETGKVLGVSTFYVEGGQNLNFAVPSAYINKLSRTPIKLPIKKMVGKYKNKLKMKVDERVEIIEPYINGCSNDLEGSIINRTDNFIKNTRLVALFFPTGSGHIYPLDLFDTEKTEKKMLPVNDPVHYMLIKVDDSIPPGFAVRFERRDQRLNAHGYNCNSHGQWRVFFRVLDYDIMEGNKNQIIPTFK
jgi:hypothetical protein